MMGASAFVGCLSAFGFGGEYGIIWANLVCGFIADRQRGNTQGN